jgi:hypothetical protein
MMRRYTVAERWVLDVRTLLPEFRPFRSRARNRHCTASSSPGAQYEPVVCRLVNSPRRSLLDFLFIIRFPIFYHPISLRDIATTGKTTGKFKPTTLASCNYSASRIPNPDHYLVSFHHTPFLLRSCQGSRNQMEPCLRVHTMYSLYFSS